MTKFLKVPWALLLVGCLLLGKTNLWGRHIIGGDMAYRYLSDMPTGEKRYSFTLNLYRDCLGGGPTLNPPGLYQCDGAVPTPPCGPPYETMGFVEPEYTPQAPLAGDPVVQIDSLTGLITGTPRRIGQFMVGIVYREFRDSVQLSEVRRSIIFNVVGNPLPVTDKTAVAPLFQIKPNPAAEQVSWDPELNIVEIQVFDLLGRRQKLLQGHGLAGMGITGLEPGHYRVLAVTRAGMRLTCPFVVLR